MKRPAQLRLVISGISRVVTDDSAPALNIVQKRMAGQANCFTGKVAVNSGPNDSADAGKSETTSNKFGKTRRSGIFCAFRILTCGGKNVIGTVPRLPAAHLAERDGLLLMLKARPMTALAMCKHKTCPTRRLCLRHTAAGARPSAWEQVWLYWPSDHDGLNCSAFRFALNLARPAFSQGA